MSDLLDEVIEDFAAVRSGVLPLSALVSTQGGDVRLVAGKQAFVLPSIRYSARFDRVWAALRLAGFDPDARLDHVSWESRYPGNLHAPETIAALSKEDLAFAVVSMRRGEHFCSGHWAQLVENGVLLAALARARELAMAPPAP